MIIAVDGSNVSASLMQIVDEFVSASKLVTFMPKTITLNNCQWSCGRYCCICYIAYTETSRTGHGRGRIAVRTANVIFTNGLSSFSSKGANRLSR